MTAGHPADPDDLCDLAQEHHQAGNIAQAEALYQEALRVDPSHPGALYFLGGIAYEDGRYELAFDLVDRLTQDEPNDFEGLHLLGLISSRLGKHDLAADSIGRALQLQPDFAHAHYSLGEILLAQGQSDNAEISFRRALTLNPQFAEAHYRLADILAARKKFSEAIASYRQALAINPDLFLAHSHLAGTLHAQGLLDEAIAAYRSALALQPDSAALQHDLAIALYSLKRLDEAVTCFRKAIALNPEIADIHSSLGLALNDQGKLDEAAASHRQAVLLQPDAARGHLNLSLTLHALGRYDEAIESARRAISLQPDDSQAHNNLGISLKALNNVSAAIASYREAISLNPDFPVAHLNMGQALLAQSRISEAIGFFQQALALKPDYIEAFDDYLMAIQYSSDYTREQLLAEHVAYGERIEAPVRTSWPVHARVRDLPRRLKIGFVSGDFRLHPVGLFLASVLRNIDREALDITLYSNNDEHDALTEHLHKMGFTWVSITRLSNADAAARIRADRIDILVDLAGHTGKNRLPVFAHKPAPVQVTWLGYWATTGLRAIDYILCDRYGIPDDEAGLYVEKPWYMPDTRLCFTPPSVDIAVNTLPAAGTRQITFGCFNNLTKMNDPVVALWSRILHKLPDSRLFLKSKSLLDTAVQQAVLDRFAAHGIAPNQLLLECESSYEEYLAAYRKVDIALDPFPFTGGTTSIEGLWMGVPVITLRGDRLIARQGEGILGNLGMSDWVAPDEDAYVAQAIARASDLDTLAALRLQLREKLLRSPLCNGARFARNLEKAFGGMWAAYYRESAQGKA